MAEGYFHPNNRWLWVNTLRQFQAHQSRRIHVNALPAYRNVQMRPGGPPGAAAQSDFLSLADLVTFLDLEFGKMHIKTQQSLPMIDDDEITFEEKRAS